MATFAVSGLNVPGAIGAARDSSAVPVAASAPTRALPRVSAAALRELRAQSALQQVDRASRTRALLATAEADVARRAALAKQEAERRAKEAARRALPSWVKPVLNYRLTAGFGESSGLWSHSHTGQDFAAPIGTPIRAIGAGRIVSAQYEGAYGRKIVIQHADGTVSWYCHMSAFMQTSGTVRAGDIIGRVGNTGNTTGPHLHLEIRPGDGVPVNPIPWLRAHGVLV